MNPHHGQPARSFALPELGAAPVLAIMALAITSVYVGAAYDAHGYGVIAVFSPWIVTAILYLRRAWRRLQVPAPASPPPQVRLRESANAARCPWCFDGFAKHPQPCSGCGAVFHGECLAEAQGCTTLACERAPTWRRNVPQVGA